MNLFALVGVVVTLTKPRSSQPCAEAIFRVASLTVCPTNPTTLPTDRFPSTAALRITRGFILGGRRVVYPPRRGLLAGRKSTAVPSPLRSLRQSPLACAKGGRLPPPRNPGLLAVVNDGKGPRGGPIMRPNPPTGAIPCGPCPPICRHSQYIQQSPREPGRGLKAEILAESGTLRTVSWTS